MNPSAAKRIRITPIIPPTTTSQSFGLTPEATACEVLISAIAATIESTAKAMSVSSIDSTVIQKFGSSFDSVVADGSTDLAS